MDTKKYFVNHNEKQLGPFLISEIMTQVKSGQLNMVDYIYDEACGDWVTLMEFKPISDSLASGNKPAAPPQKKTSPSSDSEQDLVDQTETVKIEAVPTSKPQGKMNDFEWHVLKGENKFGPFSYTDVIRMLQEKVLFEFDFAWHSALDSWVRIADLSEFSSEQVKGLQSTLMPEISQVFFRRKHKRVNYGGTIIIHDNKNVWKGKGIEISAGGAGIVMENAMVVPGQILYLHFKPGDGVPPFNAVCEVVSKKFEEGIKDKTEAIRYGVKFKGLNADSHKAILEYSRSKASSAA